MSGVLDRREWFVEDQLSHGEAASFVVANHYSRSCANTSTARHGLRRDGVDRLWGAALWMPCTPTAARAVGGTPSSVLALSRFVVDDAVPKNGASFFLGGAMRMLDRSRWPILLSYADMRLGHSGAIYRAANWECDGEVPGGDVWLDARGVQRGRKRGGRNLSVLEMRERGFVKAPAFPKIRFVHRAN